MHDLPQSLVRLIGEESTGPCLPAVVAVAEAARRRHGDAIIAVLLYGSCLREQDVEGKIVDLYLLADTYDRLHRSPVARALNRLLPPNVSYIEERFEGRPIAAKYAVVTLDHLERLISRRTLQPYFWARFAQPTVILWTLDEAVRRRVQQALAEAVGTMVGETLPLMPTGWQPAALWQRAFTETYRTELRAERADQAERLYRTFAERYDRATEALGSAVGVALPAADRKRARRRWRARRMLGKTLSVLRLIKASFTFEDGATYLVWKIRRHSGVEVELTPWQRRHPILASSVLAWRLYRAGGFR
jgi:hypothetical protein